mmetsp:Transcript_43517/g.103729  ORF Transcript_43517/g.103729 Transcript_43517/m.103729 type:complete len:236 (+) Transcript_43517:655-1362(+)
MRTDAELQTRKAILSAQSPQAARPEGSEGMPRRPSSRRGLMPRRRTREASRSKAKAPVSGSGPRQLLGERRRRRHRPRTTQIPRRETSPRRGARRRTRTGKGTRRRRRPRSQSERRRRRRRRSLAKATSHTPPHREAGGGRRRKRQSARRRAAQGRRSPGGKAKLAWKSAAQVMIWRLWPKPLGRYWRCKTPLSPPWRLLSRRSQRSNVRSSGAASRGSEPCKLAWKMTAIQRGL